MPSIINELMGGYYRINIVIEVPRWVPEDQRASVVQEVQDAIDEAVASAWLRLSPRTTLDAYEHPAGEGGRRASPEAGS